MTDEPDLDASRNQPIIDSEDTDSRDAPALQRSTQRRSDIRKLLEHLEAAEDLGTQRLLNQLEIFIGLRKKEKLARPRHAFVSSLS